MMETTELKAGRCRCSAQCDDRTTAEAEPRTTRVYIAHPYNGITGSDEEKRANLEDASAICRKLAEINPLILPVSPLHAFGFMEGMSQQEIITCCYRLIDACSEVWVFGDWAASEGTVKEIFYALHWGKTVSIYKRPEAPDGLPEYMLCSVEDLAQIATDLLFAAKIEREELSERLDQTLRPFGAAEEAAHC